MSPRLPGSFIAATNVTCIWQPGELFTRAGTGRDITGLGGASAARLSQSWVAVSFVPPEPTNQSFVEPRVRSAVAGQGGVVRADPPRLLSGEK